jgi:hypothetical protein
MANLIDINLLQREAKTYEAALQLLPFTTLMEPLSNLGINLVDVKDKNVFVSFQRKGGLSRPYVAGNPNDSFDAGEIGKVVEHELAVKPCVLPIVENVRNYKNYSVISDQPGTDNQTKKHPLERLILENVVKTVSEDIIDAMFHAKFDVTDQTPMGMFDGFGEIIDDEIAAATISQANGNLYPTGALAIPSSTSDTNTIDKIVEFVRAANPKLKKGANLLIDGKTLYHAMKALENKTSLHQLVTFEALLAYIRSVAIAPTLNIVTDDCLGEGGRLILTTPGNIELGMRTRNDVDFVQVRNFYDDPNWAQYWCQFEAGGRIRETHAKKFQVNDQVNTAVELSGDYRS